VEHAKLAIEFRVNLPKDACIDVRALNRTLFRLCQERWLAIPASAACAIPRGWRQINMAQPRIHQRYGANYSDFLISK